MSWSKSITTGR